MIGFIIINPRWSAFTVEEYINASKKQFELKNKISLEKAKIKNDKSEIILRKERFKESKYPRKYGTLSTMLYTKNELKSIYGVRKWVSITHGKPAEIKSF